MHPSSSLDSNVSRRRFLSGLALAPLLGADGPLSVMESLVTPHPSVRWQLRTDAGIVVLSGLGRNPPPPDREAMYVKGGNTLYALDVTDGEIRWNLTVTDEHWSFDVASDAIYVAGDSGLRAVGHDGSEMWQFRTGESNSGVYLATVIDETVYASSLDGLYALDVANGSQRWQFEENVGRPTVVGGTVFGTGSDTLYALATADGRERWRFDVGDFSHVVGVIDGVLYLWSQGEMYALDARDGDEQWRKSISSRSRYFGSLVNDAIYGWSGDTLLAIERTTGSTRWRFETGSEPVAVLGVANEAVYAETEDAVYAIDVASGNERWHFDRQLASKWLLGDLANDTVYTRDGDGLSALDATDGTTRWQFTPRNGQVTYAERIGTTVYAGTNAGALYALEGPGQTPIEGAVRTVRANAESIALATLLGGGVVAEAYRRTRDSGVESDPSETGVELLEHIDTDGLLETYRGRLPDGREVVVERLPETANVPPEQFRRAVEAQAELDHENVVPVLDRGTEPVPWVAVARGDGESFLDRTGMNVRERIEALAAVCEAVHVAHRNGITHGGLSPDGIQFASRGCEPTDVRIGGWIEATLTKNDRQSPYAALEQVEDRDADPVRTDVYRLGAIAYRAITGRPPDGERPTQPSELHPDLPDELDDVLAVAMANDPEERYRTALTFRDMLRWAAFGGRRSSL